MAVRRKSVVPWAATDRALSQTWISCYIDELIKLPWLFDGLLI